MRRPITALSLALLVASSCRTPPPAAPVVVRPLLDEHAATQLVETFVDAYLLDNPDFARSQGLHAFDGLVPPVGMAAVSRQVDTSRKFLGRLKKANLKALVDPVKLDVEITRLKAEQVIHLLEERAEHRHILFYASQFELTPYLQRDYAPLAQRVEACIRHLDGAVANVDGMLSMLDPVQARTHLLTARITYEGTVEYLNRDVMLAVAPALAADPDLNMRFLAQHARALKEVQRILAWIDHALPRANEGFRIGETHLLHMLEVNEGLSISLPALRAMATQDHARNLKAYEDAARRLDPTRPPREVAADAAALRVPDVLATATQQLRDIRLFLELHPIITIPGKEECQVTVTPPFLRYNSAFLDAAGPFESARTSFFYITPPDPAWPQDRQAAYLPSPATLLSTSIHEVYPGHFVQGLHQRQAPTRTQQMFSSYAFSEGWAHYAEQMMLDEGFMETDPTVRLGQLEDALLRDCRFLAAIGLHVDGMGVEAAQRLFREQCFVDEGNAQQQAFRGTYDPGFLSYTLGKLQILALRERWLALHGRDLKGFHDWLLSFGGAPVELIARRLK